MFRAHHSHSGSAQSGSELQVPPQASFGVSAALIGPRRGDGGASRHRHRAQGLSDFTRTSHTETLNICRGGGRLLNTQTKCTSASHLVLHFETLLH